MVYVTGRNLALTEEAIASYGVRPPDILCSDVGTMIRHYSDGAWRFDQGWIDHIKGASPAWDGDAIREALASVEGMRLQEEEHLNRFKQSYYVEHDRHEAILAEVNARIVGRFDEVLVYSFDSQNGNGLLDVLPASATKQTSLEYVAKANNTPISETVFCGDSGNDIFPLTAGFRGVLVRNADRQLVDQVKSAMKKNAQLQVYFATGGVAGLNGYYTSGVLEGAAHYKLLDLRA